MWYRGDYILSNRGGKTGRITDMQNVPEEIRGGMMVTIFEQDGKVYLAISHKMPYKNFVNLVNLGVRGMIGVPRSICRVVTVEEFKSMPFGSPNQTD